MSNESIKCPQCGYTIEISEVLSSQIRENLQTEFDKTLQQKDQQFHSLELKLKEQQQLLAEEKATVQQQIEKKLEEEGKIIRDRVFTEAAKQFNLELSDLKNQIAEGEKKIAHYNKIELELRKRSRELEVAREELELQLTRKIDAEREKIREQTSQKISREYHLKDIEKDKLIQDLRKALDEAKRKAEQGSVQIQGEVLELDLETVLKNHFPADEIKPVPKGIRGADVVQTIVNSNQQICGTVLWETKSTKSWSNSWIDKLKDDQREIGADVSVLVSETLPKEIENFDNLNGIWVTSYRLAIALATVLRQNLIEINFAKRSSVGKNEKMEAIYQYLSGPEFRQKVEAIVETFTGMQEQLNKEKRAMIKIWKEREKQIERITLNTINMYGELKGIIGASLPEIKLLELGSSEELE
jgi:hypothetical protein